MPNVAALVRAGITALAPGKSAREEDLAWGKEILQAFGRVGLVDEEMMNAVTAVSGSGPGFVFSFLAALTDAGVLAGLPRPLAGELALQTLLGSAKMAAESGEHPVGLQEMVTSPGGPSSPACWSWERTVLPAPIFLAIQLHKKTGRAIDTRENIALRLRRGEIKEGSGDENVEGIGEDIHQDLFQPL